MKLAVVGALGRMGAAVLRLAKEEPGVSIVGAADAPGKLVGQDVGEAVQLGTLGVAVSPDVSSALLGADAVIDFSSAKAAIAVGHAVIEHRVAWVCGTTALDDAAKRALDEAAKHVPVLQAANMSLGVQVLAELVRDAVRRLGAGFDVEIVETHHRRKADAPSGTALRLFDAVREARDEARGVFGREGIIGARRDDEVAVLAVRGGDVIGDHTVHLLGDGERIELTHRATNRDLFARGALRSAQFLAGKSRGFYTIRDVVGGGTPSPLN